MTLAKIALQPRVDNVLYFLIACLIPAQNSSKQLEMAFIGMFEIYLYDTGKRLIIGEGDSKYGRIICYRVNGYYSAIVNRRC